MDWLWMLGFGFVALAIILDLAMIILALWVGKKLIGFAQKIFNVRLVFRIEKRKGRNR